MRYALVVLTMLACGAAVAEDATWSGWWTVGKLEAAQGLAYSIDSGHVLKDLPVAGALIEKFGMGAGELGIDYDLLFGTTAEGQQVIVGAGVSIRFADEYLVLKGGVGLTSKGEAGLYVAVGLRW